MIGDMPRNPIRAKQEFCAIVNFDHFHIDFNVILGAERAANNIFAGMMCGLFGGHASGAHFFFNHRMIFSFT